MKNVLSRAFALAAVALFAFAARGGAAADPTAPDAGKMKVPCQPPMVMAAVSPARIEPAKEGTVTITLTGTVSLNSPAAACRLLKINGAGYTTQDTENLNNSVKPLLVQKGGSFSTSFTINGKKGKAGDRTITVTVNASNKAGKGNWTGTILIPHDMGKGHDKK